MLRLSLLLAAWVFLTSCSSEPRYFVYSADGTVTVKGWINEDMLSFFKGIADRPIKQVVITSSGGSLPTAFEIVDILGPGRYQLTVQDYCASACAQALFVSASEKFIRPESMVIFHNSVSGRAYLFAMSHDQHELAIDTDIASSVETERRRYAELGIDLAILDLMLLKRGDSCYADASRDGGPAGQFGILFENNGYVPSLATLEAFGVRNISGQQPRTPAELTIVARKMAEDLNRTLGFSLESAGARTTPAEVTRKMADYSTGPCDAEALARL